MADFKLPTEERPNPKEDPPQPPLPPPEMELPPQLTKPYKHPLPPGTIITPTGEQPRFNDFFASLLNMFSRYPKAMLLPDGRPRIRWVQGVDVAFNINHSIRNRFPDSEWVWITGDDHAWSPELIERLWQWQVPIVTPMVLKRSQPHHPVLWDLNMQAVQVGENEPPSLKKVGIVGGAGMLITTEALDKIGDPWFRFLPGNTERWGEDIWFCRRAAECGIPVHCDMFTSMYHANHVLIGPRWDPVNKRWQVEYRIKGACEVM